MKKYILQNIFGLIFLVCTFLSGNAPAQSSLVTDSVTMLPGYTDEVYYSMANGMTAAGPRGSWDIAFRTNKRSSSILINDGAGVVLWCYHKADTAGWTSLDTSGMAGWTPMYNDPGDWENGAFSRNARTFPDYGWGKYNVLTHDILGDSIYVISLRDGSFRKIWIIRKRSLEDIYEFKYANLDGSNEQQFSLDLTPYLEKEFYGWSLESNSGVDYQPIKANWDILFTKYMSVQPDGTPYPVTGVLNNLGVKSKSFHPVSLDYNQWWVNSWDSLRSSIGYDWKIIDMGTYTYKVKDSLVYFVRTLQGDVYKLIFTKFEGSSTGVIDFETQKVSSVGINEHDPFVSSVSIYPNPAREYINVYMDSSPENQVITLCDVTGKTLYRSVMTTGQNKVSIDVSGLSPGIYFVTVHAGSGSSVKKVIISR